MMEPNPTDEQTVVYNSKKLKFSEIQDKVERLETQLTNLLTDSQKKENWFLFKFLVVHAILVIGFVLFRQCSASASNP